MNQPKAYGTFIKRGEYTFRTSSYIQWGNSEQSIGASLLLNPGSAQLDKELLNELNLTGSAQGGIRSTDPTMKQLIRLIEGTHSSEQHAINGRFYLYNLFSLQEASSKKAIEHFEYLIDSKICNMNSFLCSVKELESHPWILLGWGVERNTRWTNFELMKKKWLELIKESNIPSFGKRHPKSNNYYHPCPLIPTKQPAMLENLSRIYKSEIETRSASITPKRFTLLKWNNKYGEESKFIARDNFNNTQSVFSPGRTLDLVWFYADLANDESISDWSEFDEDSFDELEPIAFKECL